MRKSESGITIDHHCHTHNVKAITPSTDMGCKSASKQDSYNEPDIKLHPTKY